MAAAASGGASSGDANDDAGPGRCCERQPWVGCVGLATAPGGAVGASRPRVSRVGRAGPDAWAGLRAAALSVASDANS